MPINQGLARYSAQGEVMIVTWALEEEPVQLWDCTDGVTAPPAPLVEAIRRATRLVAHNAHFDRTMLGMMPWWGPSAGMVLPPWFCTMAMAYRHGLPGGLDKLSTIFKLPDDFAKIDGKQFIQLFCKLVDGKRNTRLTHPKLWREFCEYAKQDIRAMREIYYQAPSWNDTAFELRLHELDYKINRRGVYYDEAFVKHAIRATTAEKARLEARTTDITDEFVLRATQRDNLLRYLFLEHGVELPDLKQDTVERRLDDPELSPLVKELLRIRISSTKSSTAKYKRMLNIGFMNRLHFLLQYGGAYRTLRYAGRNVQPQNFPRPKHKFEEILAAMAAITSGDEEMLLGDEIMQYASDALRSTLTAAPGKKLIVSDLQNIEGRFLPWLANDRPMLDYFEQFDLGLAEDYYKVIFGRTFGVDPADVTKDQRQIGKVLELAFAIGGGVGACVTAAATYRIDLEWLSKATFAAAPKHILSEARETWLWAVKKRRTMGLPEHIYVACEALKVLWRQARQPTVDLWAACQEAAQRAIMTPGQVFKAGPILEFDRKGTWLRMKLPSGRYCLYPNAKFDEVEGITYMAWNLYRKGWYRERTYGAKFASDGRQAGSRDVLVHSFEPMEAEGYEIVLSVHDEAVTETPDDPAWNVERLNTLLATPKVWAPGLPLAASGFEGRNYRKE